MEKGYVQVYTGDGKGKTTAAFGLAIRAVCAGKKVFIGQFVKGMKYSETKIEDMIDNIVIKQFGEDCFINVEPTPHDIELAKQGFNEIVEILNSDEYDMVILDELNIATLYKLIEVDDVIEALKNRNPKIEVIITGRYADKKLIEYADLVTEMKEIKHYYRQGVEARDGIER
ncbi:MAG: cob(I)yrinic acid a,c-diamide adenosyltransferase [Tissierellia bacterium]|nr:cob(I)yrinic acid a,c-diamide adenosyltransferase [Tissierellia bacterium]